MPDSSSFESAALAMHGNGYSLLPIGAGTKSPGIYRGFVNDEGAGPWFGLTGWRSFCTERESAAKTAAWGRMADAYGGGLGVATGFGSLIAIDVDDDALIDPIFAVLPPVMVAKRGRKGVTAFYRGEHPRDEGWWRKRNYKTEEKHGLLDFLADGAQTVLPPTVHPDIGRPYGWTTERTLLDVPLSELPVFTETHRAEMEGVLRRFGWTEASGLRGVALPLSGLRGRMIWTATCFGTTM